MLWNVLTNKSKLSDVCEDSGGNLIEKFVVVNLAILDVLVDLVNFSNFVNLVDKVGSVQELFNFK